MGVIFVKQDGWATEIVRKEKEQLYCQSVRGWHYLWPFCSAQTQSCGLASIDSKNLICSFRFFDHQCFLSIQPIFCEHFHSELSRRSLCEGLLADLAHFVAFCRFGHRNFRILKIDKQMRSLRSRLRLRSGFHECLRPWWYLFEGCCYMSVSGEYIYNIDIIYIYIYMSV